MTRLVLSAVGQPKGDVLQVWLWIAVLMVVVVIGGLLLVVIRKRAQSGGGSNPAVGLSLADLREMKADGRLSEEEFERAKAMVIGELGGKVEGRAAERVRIDGRVVDGELRARQGYDLTGQKLPDFGGDDVSPMAGDDGDGGVEP